jgi:hypothetical protein
VLGGLTILVGLVLIAEGVLWPAERRLQVSLATPGGAVAEESVRREAGAMMAAAIVTVVLLVAGSALMVAQP